MTGGLLLAGLSVAQLSHGLRSYIALKLKPHAALGGEMKKIKMAAADRISAQCAKRCQSSLRNLKEGCQKPLAQ